MKKFLLLACCCYLACNSTTTTGPIDDNKADTIILNTRTTIHDLMVVGDQDKLQAYLDSLRPIFEGNHHNGLASSWYQIQGITLALAGDSMAAKHHMHIGLVLARQRDTTNKYYGGALVNTGRLHLILGHLDSSLLFARKGYGIAKDAGDDSQIINACQILSEAYRQMNDPENMLAYLREGLQMCLHDPVGDFFVNNLAVYHWDNGHHDSAIYYYQVMIDSSYHERSSQVQRYQNLGVIFTELKRFEEAKTNLDNALHLAKSVGQELDWTYSNMASHYKARGDMKNTVLYLDSATAIARNTGNLEILVEAYGELKDVSAHQKDYAKALMYSDSLYAAHLRYDTMSRAIEARKIDARVAMTEMDKKLSQLQAEKAENKQADLKKQIMWGTICLILVLAIGCGILLSRRKRRKTLEREHALQQQLLRSQLEPHFIYNSLGTLHSYVNGNDKEKAVDYLQKFSKLAKISLVNARETWVPLTDEIEALDAYLALQASNYQTFSYKVEIFEGYRQADLLVPPMLLQPFVENAVIHGVGQMDADGKIVVTIEKGNHFLHCSIEDNGPGLRHRTDAPGKPSLSSLITEERLSLLGRGENVAPSLRIQDKKQSMGRGVRVELELPYRYEE